MKKFDKQATPVIADQLYIFAKSGNEVKAIAPTTRYRGQPMWEVERTTGASAGKRLDVPERALTPLEYVTA